MRLSIVLVALLIAGTAQATSYVPQFPQGLEQFTTIEGIKFNDASGKHNPPSIPKSWKLISVSNGEKANANNLWFQDSDGSVYLLQGFTSRNKFIIHEHVYKIPAK
ncbi:MAG: hypothetical protein EG822_18015 [Deltaproteobacteria bacterium]|nr:hypothetical protein [Deltaproteobacteria bacterium]TLN00920.1 MAG: hypothetical protein FDZ73_17845 [bacterium]